MIKRLKAVVPGIGHKEDALRRTGEALGLGEFALATLKHSCAFPKLASERPFLIDFDDPISPRVTDKETPRGGSRRHPRGVPNSQILLEVDLRRGSCGEVMSDQFPACDGKGVQRPVRVPCEMVYVQLKSRLAADLEPGHGHRGYRRERGLSG